MTQLEENKTNQEVVKEWLAKEIKLTIEEGRDVELFSVILGQMLADCMKDEKFREWLSSGEPKDLLKATTAITRPILLSYMYSKENILKESVEKPTDKEGNDGK